MRNKPFIYAGFLSCLATSVLGQRGLFVPTADGQTEPATQEKRIARPSF